jgi:hypothetical protein
VPLDKSLLKACPLLVEGDRLSLSSDFKLDDISLIDQPLRAVHKLTIRGSIVVRLLLEAPTYQTLVAVSSRYNIDETTLRELLGFLNQIGGLRRKRTRQLWLIAIRTHCLHLVIGINYVPVSYRRPANLVTVSIGTLRAITPVILATGVIAGLFQAAGFAPLPTVSFTVICLSLAFFLSISFHELMHCLVLKHSKIGPLVLQSGMHLGIIHPKPPVGVDVVSSLAGPLAGMLFCLLLGGLSLMIKAHLLGYLMAALALLHSISLAPFYGDGASLQRALHERKQRKTSETHP